MNQDIDDLIFDLHGLNYHIKERDHFILIHTVSMKLEFCWCIFCQEDHAMKDSPLRV